MNSQIELYQQKIKELEAEIAAMKGVEVGFNRKPLTQLPNGDLWRGNPVVPVTITAEESEEIRVKAEKEEADDPLEKAMANIKVGSKGNLRTLTCTWCGAQTEGINADKNMRYHLKTQHKSVLTRDTDAAVLMASLADAQQQLAAANAG